MGWKYSLASGGNNLGDFTFVADHTSSSSYFILLVLLITSFVLGVGSCIPTCPVRVSQMAPFDVLSADTFQSPPRPTSSRERTFDGKKISMLLVKQVPPLPPSTQRETLSTHTSPNTLPEHHGMPIQVYRLWRISVIRKRKRRRLMIGMTAEQKLDPLARSIARAPVRTAER